MSETKWVGRWVFEPTGEVRPPKKGEWYQVASLTRGFFCAAEDWPYRDVSSRQILRQVEQPREVTRPSRESVELAKMCQIMHNEDHTETSSRSFDGCGQSVCRRAAAILDAEAAFAEVPPPPAYDPQDVAFARDLAAVTPPLSVPPADLPRVLAALTEYGAVEVAESIEPPPTDREVRFAEFIVGDTSRVSNTVYAEAAALLAAAKETDRGHS